MAIRWEKTKTGHRAVVDGVIWEIRRRKGFHYDHNKVKYGEPLDITQECNGDHVYDMIKNGMVVGKPCYCTRHAKYYIDNGLSKGE